MEFFIGTFITVVFIIVFVGGLLTFGLHAFVVTKIFQKALQATDDLNEQDATPTEARVECTHCGATAVFKPGIKCTSCGAPLEPA